MSKILLKMAQIKQLDYKDIDKYSNIYQAAYNKIWDFMTKYLDFFNKKASMILQTVMFLNRRNKYARIMSIIELK